MKLKIFVAVGVVLAALFGVLLSNRSTSKSEPATRVSSPRGEMTVKRASGSIAGTVRTIDVKQGGEATVCLHGANLSGAQTIPVCTETAMDGTYRFDGVKSGVYRLSASAPRYVSVMYEEHEHFGFLRLEAGEVREYVDFLLQVRGVELAGSISDILGGVVQGAWIYSPDTGGVSTSDALGQFTMWTVPGPLSLSIKAEGYALRRYRGVAPDTTVSIALAPESILRGKVEWAETGTPVADAWVEAGPVGGVALAVPSTKTKSDGSFEIANLGAGLYRPRATVVGGYGVTAASEHLRLGETSPPLVIVMHKSASVNGRIELSDSKEPCAIGEVALIGADSIQRFEAQADGAGNVKFDGVPEGAYNVEVTCEGALARSWYPQVNVYAGTLDEHVWLVDSGAHVWGLVVAPNRDAVAQVRVAVRTLDGTTRETRSAADGTFSFSGLPEGPCEVRALASHYASPPPSKLTLTNGITQQVDIELVESAEIFGVVTTHEGKPLRGAQVMALDLDNALWSVMTNEEGEYELSGVSGPALTLRVRKGGESVLLLVHDALKESVSVTLPNEMGRVEMNLEVGPASGSIKGKVVGSDGLPLGDVYIEYSREQSRDRLLSSMSPTESRVLTDDDGEFEIADLFAGKYKLRARASDGAERVVLSEVGDDVLIELSHVRTISGRVVSVSGNVVGAFRIQARRNDGFIRTEPFFSSDGSWKLEGLAAGDYGITAASTLGTASQRIALTSKTDIEGIVLRISAGEISGRVVSATTGTPLAGCRVVARSRSGGPWIGSGTSNENISKDDGEFKLAGVPTGFVSLWYQNDSGDCADYMNRLVGGRVLEGDSTRLSDVRLRETADSSLGTGTYGMRVVSPPGGDELSLVIGEITTDGPADRAGLLVGDAIEAIDGEEVATKGFVFGVLTNVALGMTVTLTVRDKNFTLTAVKAK